jgi:4-hydroxybenzoate polyprenyltransferase
MATTAKETATATAAHAGRWRALVRIHRLEYPYPVNYLCHAGWGACYAVAGPGGLLTGPVLLAVAANFILLVAQNPLNAAGDMYADDGTPGKRGIGAATRRLGPRTAARIAGAEMAAGLAIAAAVSVLLGSPVVVLVSAFRVGLDLLYNLRPVRLKGRGFANPVTLGLCFGTLPWAISYNAAGGHWASWVWLTSGGIGVLVTGRALWFSLSDMRADAAAGDRTPVVRHGVHRALVIACAITVAGLGLVAAGMGQRYGLPVGVLVTATSAAFLVYLLGQLRSARRGDLPDYNVMRHRALSLVALADTVLLMAPFLA